MSVNNFIPTIWAGEVLLNLHKAQIFAQPGIINRMYQGNIQNAGDSVRIGAIGPITVSTYARNTQLGAPQFLQDASVVMQVDQQDLIYFAIDDLDELQALPNLMPAATYEAGYAISNKADQFIANLMAANVSGGNTIGQITPITGTSMAPTSAGFSTAYDNIVLLAQYLDVANVPQDGRWIVVPPWFYALLRRDLRFVGYGTPPNRETLTNGLVGSVAGFEVFKSNNCATSGSANNPTTAITAGHSMAVTYADQVVKMEALRLQQYVADAVRGYHVYGAKVIRPQALAVLYATPT